MSWVIKNIPVRCACGQLFDRITEHPPIPMIVTHYEMPDSQGDPDGHVVHCPVCDRECEEATEVRLGI